MAEWKARPQAMKTRLSQEREFHRERLIRNLHSYKSDQPQTHGRVRVSRQKIILKEGPNDASREKLEDLLLSGRAVARLHRLAIIYLVTHVDAAIGRFSVDGRSAASQIH
jgi:hypothetical protein